MKVMKNNQKVQTFKTKGIIITPHAQQRCMERGISEKNMKSSLSRAVLKEVTVLNSERRLVVRTRNSGKDVDVCLGMTKGKHPKYVIISAWEAEKRRKEVQERKDTGQSEWRHYKEKLLTKMMVKEKMDDYMAYGM